MNEMMKIRVAGFAGRARLGAYRTDRVKIGFPASFSNLHGLIEKEPRKCPRVCGLSFLMSLKFPEETKFLPGNRRGHSKSAPRWLHKPLLEVNHDVQKHQCSNER